MILDDILHYREIQLKREKEELAPEKIVSLIEKQEKNNKKGFLESITSYDGMSIIAEVKKASPSKGIIKEDFKPLLIAKEYEASDVQCISVLTEEHYFLGSNKYLNDISKETSIPLLRKDFIFDEYQIYHAKLLGASAILLIAAILDSKTIKSFLRIANELELDALIEVHDGEELQKVLENDVKILGINNRNLKNFHTTLETTEKLIEAVPEGVTVISESGIKDSKDVDRLLSCGAKGMLIGESLMRADSISGMVKELRKGGK